MRTRHLSSNGYQVLSTASGREALEIAQQLPAPLSLLLTGLLLPGLTGFELAKSLKARSSSLEVIYITAHQADLSAGDVRSPILMKPFAPASLLRAVRSHLPQALEASDSERQRTHQPSRSADEAGPA